MAEITSLSLTVGVPTHVTVVDHNNADAPLPPASISWAVSGFLTLSMITADATGFIFLANSPVSGTATATYHNGAISSPGPALAVSATAAVQPAYVSP